MGIRRLPDGTVDPTDPTVDAVLDVLAEIRQARPADQIQGLAELLRLLLDLDWWELFIALAWPDWVPAPFAQFHREFWSWLLALEEGKAPRPYIACWPRGAAKSSTAQLAIAWVALKGLRSYVLYVGETQKSGEKKIADIANLIQTPIVRVAFPEVATIYRDNLGRERDWTKARIRTASGFTLDALGMDVAIRGVKVDDDRPGMIVLDDLEDHTDSEYMTGKKLETVAGSIIPAGQADTAFVFIQNKIHDESIMATLTDGRAEIFQRRIVSGPIPQVLDLEWERVEIGPDDYEYKITGGVFTWPEGLGLDVSTHELNLMGPTWFGREKQHTGRKGLGLWSERLLQQMRRPPTWPQGQAGGLIRVVVAVDPSSGTGTGSECGIVVVGLCADKRAYILEDASIRGGPEIWVRQIVDVYQRWGAVKVVAEINNGYQLVLETIGRYATNLPVTDVKAKVNKILRAEPAHVLSETDRVRFAGDFPQLRHQMNTYDGTGDSPDRLDAAVYGILDVLPPGDGEQSIDLIRRRPR